MARREKALRLEKQGPKDGEQILFQKALTARVVRQGTPERGPKEELGFLVVQRKITRA